MRDPYAADVESRRAEHERWLRGPAGYLAAVERIELPIGATREVHGLVIEALPDGFRVDGERTGPRTVETGGRYRLRLSHQNFPAIVILDAEIEVYFSDATSGRESYRMRYVPAEREGDRWLLDFNRTYNPACAWSPFYNCPLPPAENRLPVALRVGEMSPGTSSAAETTGGRPWRQEAKS